MGEIFHMPDNRSMVMHTEGNRIVLYTLPPLRGGNPYLVEQDFLDHFDCMLWEGKLVYVYENTEHKVIVDCIGAGERIEIPLLEKGQYVRGKLWGFQGQVCLFYLAFLPESAKYQMSVCLPYQYDRKMVLEESEGACIFFQMLELGGKYYVFTRARNQDKAKAYLWRGELDFEALPDGESAFKEEGERWKAEEKRWAMHYEEAQRRYQAEKQELVAQYEEMIRGQKEKQLEIVKQYEGKIQAAQLQYEELAETARNLQKIGKAWRDKYYEEQ